MKRHRALALLIVLSIACATVGPGDATVVRAEDLLSNSLTVYSSAMSWHFTHSTQETSAVYKTFETFRVKFPIAWNALDQAKRAYKLDKSKGTASLDAALNALAALVSSVAPLIGGS